MEETWKSLGSRRGTLVRLGKNADVVYNEEDVIGRGQFGTVYRGLCPATKTVVAVKLLQNLPETTATTPAPSAPASEHGRRGTEASSHEASHGAGATPDAASSPTAAAAAAAAAGAAEASGAPKVRPPGFPSELAILCDVRADRCPNIVNVISMWNKVLRHPRSQGKDGAGAPSATTSTSASQRPTRLFVMVTEYCEGGDLQQFLKARGAALPAHVARSFTYQLCNALLTLRRRRIVHRDVKPANLLLTSLDSETATLKLADFGMAKAAPAPRPRRASTDAEGTAATKTKTASAGAEEEAFSPLFYSEMGTPMYMSPERLALQPYDYKADVYSAGMVLLEMMRGACVQVKWESQLRTEVPRTIWRELRQYPPDRVPLWLDLVQGMTATDPAKRLSVEDVLRHAWFSPSPQYPLPPLTFPLREVQPGQPHAGPAASTPSVVSVVSGNMDAGGVSPPPPPSRAAGGGVGTEEASSNSANGTHAHREPHQHPTQHHVDPSSASAADPGVSTSPKPSQSASQSPRPSEPSAWTVLGICAEVDAVHNVAGGAYTGPAKHPSATSPSHGAAPAATALALPPGCGPHIITNAVRAFVDAAYLYVLQDELDAVRGLALVSYLMELMQNGYAAYLTCLDALGCSWRDAAHANSCALGGHRLVVREVSRLVLVWRQLMARLHAAQTAYTARLPLRMLDSAAAWRRRLLGTAGGGGGGADDAEEEAGDVGGTTATAAADPHETSMTLSDADVAMSGLPSITSIPNTTADVAFSATGPLLGLPSAASASAPPDRLRVSSVCARAEQLIFDKAVDFVQSEALSLLMDAAAAQPPPTPLMDDGDEDLDGTDCLEEEEEAARAGRSRATTSAPTPSPMPQSQVPSAVADTQGRQSAAPHRPLPPHHGVALLRVLLRRAVLTLAEVGLEVDGAAAPPPPAAATTTQVAGAPQASPSSPPLYPTLPSLILAATAHSGARAAASLSLEAVAKYVFVVQVPVYGTLDKRDVQTVENLLHAATRVFSSATSSLS